jgi:hypothetical protein
MSGLEAGERVAIDAIAAAASDMDVNKTSTEAE